MPENPQDRPERKAHEIMREEMKEERKQDNFIDGQPSLEELLIEVCITIR